MGKIAVIKAGGKQYKVSEGQKLKIEKLVAKDGDKVKFDTLLTALGGEVSLGRPSLGEKVEAKVARAGLGDKVSVIKYKSKTRYRRNVGHRQPFTEVEILSIS